MRVVEVVDGGANGTPGYTALEAYDAQEFYAESTPIWWAPGRTFDLRNTWTTFYLKELEPIRVAPGYEPRWDNTSLPVPADGLPLRLEPLR